MHIVTEPSKCEKIYQGHYRSILNSYGFKRILNKYYRPDSYLFFTDRNEFIPLVVKNRLVTFYGGRPFNHFNSLPNNMKLINRTLEYISSRQYRCHLTSITDNPHQLLMPGNRKYEVPFPVIWLYEDIQNFSIEKFLNPMTAKKRYEYRYVLKKMEEYDIHTYTLDDFHRYFPSVYKKHVDYFRMRNRKTGWENHDAMLWEILEYFSANENILIRLIEYNGDLRGFYVLVFNSKELVFYIGTSLQKKDKYISKIIYFDMFQNASKISGEYDIPFLNGLRGAYTNKRRFGFAPHPVYALVDDPEWEIRYDPDLTEDECKKIYNGLI